jgi:hypothetical protein
VTAKTDYALPHVPQDPFSATQVLVQLCSFWLVECTNHPQLLFSRLCQVLAALSLVQNENSSLVLAKKLGTWTKIGVVVQDIRAVVENLGLSSRLLIMNSIASPHFPPPVHSSASSPHPDLNQLVASAFAVLEQVLFS